YYELAHNEDGTFKSAERLQEIYGALIATNREIIPYCAVGARSGHTWYVLKYLLGYDRVRNYDGSWNEWSRLDDAAIEN
ncbi:MAG: rhodanese-like domain-containing protein, partial [Cyanobacteria bacterium J06635_13]